MAPIKDPARLRFKRAVSMFVLGEESHDLKIWQIVAAMIAFAKDRRGAIVLTTFNNVTIWVTDDSDPELLLRDYYAAFFGNRSSKQIGPGAVAELSGLEGHDKADMATANFWNSHRPGSSFTGPCCRGSYKPPLV